MQKDRADYDQEVDKAVSCNEADRPVPDNEVLLHAHHVEHNEAMGDEKRYKLAK